MRKITTVAWKESRQIMRDRLSLAMLLGVPAMLLVLYGYALSFDVENIRLAVADRDHSRHSRDLVAAFVNSGYFELVRSTPGDIHPEELTERREAMAILIIPEGFSRELEASRASDVQLILDGANANSATTALNYARTIVGEANRSILLRAVRRAGGEIKAPIEVRGRFWYNPELRSSHYLVPGLMGFILMVTSVIATALSVVREKERGTLDQLRLTPLTTLELVVGKTLPYLGLSLVAALIILFFAWLLFGVVVRGSSWDLLGVTTLYLIGALGWGLFVSTLATTQQQAFMIGIMTSMLPAIILSGFIFPIRSMPEVLQWITYAVPARYYLVIVRGIILKGTSLATYPVPLASLALFTFLVMILAAARLGRRER